MLIGLIGMNGMVMVQDIFSLYVFLEIVSVTSFILIAFEKQQSAFEGSFKYVVFSVVATVLMLSAIAIFVLAAGDTSFSAVKTALGSAGASSNTLVIIGIVLFLSGMLIKGGYMPFHAWLPDAYTSSPAYVSVLLAGIITKISGVYTMMRIILDVFTFTEHIKSMLLIAGLVSMIGGALAAYAQKDMKRLLSFSSISQMGYILLGFSCGTSLGIAAALFHFFNHAIFKSLLFVNAAAVETSTGSRNMETLGGLSSRMPITGFSSLVASLATAGIPPLSGFWSKLIIIIALWLTGHFAAAIIAVLVSVLTLGYMLTLQRDVFFGELNEDLITAKEAGFGNTMPALILTAITLAVGVGFPFVMDRFVGFMNSFHF
jgi:multicomponent Na+:H+ antiporter subunit D